MGEMWVERIPPYWCPICHKETAATIRGDGKHHELVCPTCGNKVEERKEFNPSRR